MELKERFGKRLRELRKERRLTQQGLGDLADVNYKFIGGIERGTENPSLAVVFRLAKALKVAPRELFELDHIRSPKQLRRDAMRLVEKASADDLQQMLKVLTALLD